MTNSKERYTQLDVEKLNNVDKDGKVKMTLFNQENIPPLMMDGKDILPGHRQDDPIAGIMFYNGKGEECGGLIYGSQEDEAGNVYAGASLTFDQYRQDQVVQVQYEEENGQREYGFYLYDRPNTPMPEIIERQHEITSSDLNEERKLEELRKIYQGNTQRAFFGKDANGDVAVQLMDSKGRQRIRMVVDQQDVPRIEFLNAQGEVTYTLPPEE
jgi:hypothetical protein